VNDFELLHKILWNPSSLALKNYFLAYVDVSLDNTSAKYQMQIQWEAIYNRQHVLYMSTPSEH